MGYYNKVRLLTTEKAWDKLVKAIDKYNDEHEDAGYARQLCEPDAELHGGDMVYVAWESIRWWEERWPAQAFFMETLRNSGEPYRWIRAGEDLGDVETHNNDKDDKLPDLYAEVCFNDEEIETILAKTD